SSARHAACNRSIRSVAFDSESVRELSFGAKLVFFRSFQHAGVAEWQTRWTQNPVIARSCGFKSLRRQTSLSSFRINVAPSWRLSERQVFVLRLKQKLSVFSISLVPPAIFLQLLLQISCVFFGLDSKRGQPGDPGLPSFFRNGGWSLKQIEE